MPANAPESARTLSDDALAVPLSVDEVDPASVLDGSPEVRSRALDTLGDVEVGIWEITEGTVTDTEIDEVFVVLAGAGEVAFESGETTTLAPGVVVRLHAGDRTTWTISSTLRKLYIGHTG